MFWTCRATVCSLNEQLVGDLAVALPGSGEER
jgi:hypothetical protein